jgi:hypothetical protein
VVQCGDGDITEQSRCVRTSADMVNTRAAKLAAGANDFPETRQGRSAQDPLGDRPAEPQGLAAPGTFPNKRARQNAQRARANTKRDTTTGFMRRLSSRTNPAVFIRTLGKERF